MPSVRSFGACDLVSRRPNGRLRIIKRARLGEAKRRDIIIFVYRG